MKLIIAGHRDRGVDPEHLTSLVRGLKILPTEVVSGKAPGIDRCGEIWAEDHGLPVKPFPYLRAMGKAGGPLRNQQMAEYADACLAFPGSDSKGTWNMVANMAFRGKRVWVYDIDECRWLEPSEWKEPNTPPALNPGEVSPKDKQ